MNRPDDRSVPLFGALALLALTTALMYGLSVAFAALYAWRHGLVLPAATAHIQHDLLTLTMAQVLAMGTALLVGLRLFAPDSAIPDALGLHPVRRTTLALCFAGGACLQFPLTELSNVLHAHVFGPDPLEQQLALQNMIEARSLGQGAIVVLCLVALVPTMEELLFRGLLLSGMAGRYGRGFGLFVSACLFGLAHIGIGPVAVVYATIAGFVLGGLALATRSVWPGIALHAAVNAVPVLFPEHMVAIRGFNIPSAVPQHLSAWLVWIPLACALGLLAMAARIEYARER